MVISRGAQCVSMVVQHKDRLRSSMWTMSVVCGVVLVLVLIILVDYFKIACVPVLVALNSATITECY